MEIAQAMCKSLLLISLAIYKISAIFHSLTSHDESSRKYGAISEELETADMRDDVKNFVAKVLLRESSTSITCFITDKIYYREIYSDALIKSLDGRMIYLLYIEDAEKFDKETDEKKLHVLTAMKERNCDFYVILITNGIQMINFLTYSDNNRLLNTRAKFVVLHDYRLFAPDLHYIWRRLINVIFIRKYDTTEYRRHWYELSTVPYPIPIRDVFVSRVVNYWIPPDQFLKKNQLFEEGKSQQLDGNELSAVVYPHSPAVMKIGENETEAIYSGLEIDLIRAIGDKMNFKVQFYESTDSAEVRLGSEIAMGNFSGLLGEMNEAKADFALADLYYSTYNLEVMDLSSPYTIECLTFLTPEVLTDNSWQTLLLPFALEMWIGILVSILCIIVIFFLFSKVYMFMKNDKTAERDIFDDIAACVIYSYSMILVVSIPSLPQRWSVRVLTGWWWIYCVLVVTAYRASLTSILANPQPRVTIDTLDMLAHSGLTCGTWGKQNRDFFENSDDDVADKIGDKLEEISDEEGVKRVDNGDFAYFDSRIELRRLRLEYEKKQTKVVQSLHIMEECTFNIPVSIGLDKNSPLKPKIDELIQYAIEGGLIGKWFQDAISSFAASIEGQPEEALMDIKKFYGALVALGCGLILSFLVFLIELYYWHYFVKRHPKYDKYFCRIIEDCDEEFRKIKYRQEKQRQKRRRAFQRSPIYW